MQRFRKHLMLSGLAVSILLGGEALAKNGEGGGGGGKKGKHGWHKGGKNPEKMMKKLEQLGLSDEQRTKIKALHESHRDERKTQRESAKAAQAEFQQAMQSGQKSDDELTALHEKVVNTRSDQMRMRFKHMLQVRQVLTDEQRSKFRDMMPSPQPEGDQD